MAEWFAQHVQRAYGPARLGGVEADALRVILGPEFGKELGVPARNLLQSVPELERARPVLDLLSRGAPAWIFPTQLNDGVPDLGAKEAPAPQHLAQIMAKSTAVVRALGLGEVYAAYSPSFFHRTAADVFREVWEREQPYTRPFDGTCSDCKFDISPLAWCALWGHRRAVYARCAAEWRAGAELVSALHALQERREQLDRFIRWGIGSSCLTNDLVAGCVGGSIRLLGADDLFAILEHAADQEAGDRNAGAAFVTEPARSIHGERVSISAQMAARLVLVKRLLTDALSALKDLPARHRRPSFDALLSRLAALADAG